MQVLVIHQLWLRSGQIQHPPDWLLHRCHRQPAAWQAGKLVACEIDWSFS
jgi:hypothetical protein